MKNCNHKSYKEIRKQQLISEGKVAISVLLSIVIFTYCLFSFFGFLLGVSNIDYKSNNGCKTSWARMEYLAPAYRFGCYMGSPPGE